MGFNSGFKGLIHPTLWVHVNLNINISRTEENW